jgi:large subunit ribosomal protein L14
MQTESKVMLIDNSGGKWAKVIGILDKKREANVGDRIVVSIQSAATAANIGKLKKGEIHHAVVVQSRKGVYRKDGTYVS